MTARDPFGMKRFCRGCGCTERDACVVETSDGFAGCAWVLLDLDAPSGMCSACAIELEWDQTELHALSMFSAPRRPSLVRAS